MTDPKEAPKEFLQEALEASDRLNRDRAELKRIKDQQAQDERLLEERQTAVQKEKQKLVNERRSSLQEGYDKQIKTIDKDIRELSDKRKKARSKGVKSRIKDETAELRGQKKNRQKELKALTSQAGLPRFAANRAYYALFMPKGPGEWIAAALCFLLIFIGLPMLLYAILPGSGMLKHMLIYVVIILGFGGLYMHATDQTKLKSPDTVRQGRAIVDEIKKDERSIRKITRGIKRDKDDGAYDLGAFDDELSELDKKRRETEEQRSKVLLEFDNVTSNILRDEIDLKYKEELSSLAERKRLGAARLSEKQGELSKEEADILQYIQYVGKDNIEHDRIEALLGMLDRGDASTLSEALDKLRQDKG